MTIKVRLHIHPRKKCGFFKTYFPFPVQRCRKRDSLFKDITKSCRLTGIFRIGDVDEEENLINAEVVEECLEVLDCHGLLGGEHGTHPLPDTDPIRSEGIASFRSPDKAQGDKLIQRNLGRLTIRPKYVGDEVCIVSDPFDVVPDEEEFFLE